MREIYITDNLRMYRSDERNITLEKLTNGINPRTREQTSSWKIVGYFRTFNKALEHVIDKDLLIDGDKVTDLLSYLNELKRVRDDVEKLVKENEQC